MKLEIDLIFIFLLVLFGVYFYWNRTVRVRFFKKQLLINSPLLSHAYMWQSTVINRLHLTEIKISVFSIQHSVLLEVHCYASSFIFIHYNSPRFNQTKDE